MAWFQNESDATMKQNMGWSMPNSDFRFLRQSKPNPICKEPSLEDKTRNRVLEPTCCW